MTWLYGCSGGPKNHGLFTFIQDGRLMRGMNNMPCSLARREQLHRAYRLCWDRAFWWRVKG